MTALPELASAEAVVLPPPLEPSGRMATWAKRGLPPLGVFIVLLAVWELVGQQEWVSDLVLPRPSAIGSALGDLVASGLLWRHLGVTLYETVVGFLVGAGSAFVLAVLSSFWPLFRTIVSPYMISLQVTPRVALAPIFVTWFGFGLMPKIVMAATICFFPVFINTLTGLLTSDRETLELFHSMRANKRQIFTQLTLPNALPVTFAGLKTGLTLALIGAIVGEFVATNVGLGLLIDRFTFRLDMAGAFAVLVVLTITGLFLYGVMAVIDRTVVFWTHDDRLVRRGTRARHQTRRRVQ